MLSGINSVVNLSILSGQSLASCSDIVTDDLTALGLEANQASDFVDKLASTITRSNTNVELYGYALTQCGAQAGTLGVNVTDLNTVIGLMANAGRHICSVTKKLVAKIINLSRWNPKFIFIISFYVGICYNIYYRGRLYGKKINAGGI